MLNYLKARNKINYYMYCRFIPMLKVSINRILYKHDGRIKPNSDTYKNIEKLVLQKYFAEFYFEFEKEKNEIMLIFLLRNKKLQIFFIM